MYSHTLENCYLFLNYTVWLLLYTPFILYAVDPLIEQLALYIVLKAKTVLEGVRQNNILYLL